MIYLVIEEGGRYGLPTAYKAFEDRDEAIKFAFESAKEIEGGDKEWEIVDNAWNWSGAGLPVWDSVATINRDTYDRDILAVATIDLKPKKEAK